MKIRSAIAMVVLSLCGSVLGQSNDPYKLAVSVEDAEVMSGVDIPLNITLTNLSGQDVKCCFGNGLAYLYYVHDSSGNLLKEREQKADPLGRFSGSVGDYNRKTLRAGQSLADEGALSSYVFPGLTKPGTYTLQLGWGPDLGETGEVVVKSNIITVTVTERMPFTLEIDGFADGKAAERNWVVSKTAKGIGINIVKRNISKQEIDCSDARNIFTGLDDKYQYDVRDSNGDPVPQRTIQEPQNAHPYIETISCKPDTPTVSPSLVLDKVYDLTKPGVYTIRVSQPVSENPLDGEVRSNKITVTVVP